MHCRYLNWRPILHGCWNWMRISWTLCHSPKWCVWERNCQWRLGSMKRWSFLLLHLILEWVYKERMSRRRGLSPWWRERIISQCVNLTIKSANEVVVWLCSDPAFVLPAQFITEQLDRIVNLDNITVEGLVKKAQLKGKLKLFSQSDEPKESSVCLKHVIYVFRQ